MTGDAATMTAGTDDAMLARLRTRGGGPGRIAVFWVEVGYALGLGALAYWALVGPAPGWLRIPATVGFLPTGVIWFGALGGVLISLTGVFEHRHDWDRAYWTWHVARPIMGAAIGAVAVIAFQCGVLAVGSQPQATGDNANLFYYLVAFVVGYREESARSLIKRLADVLLTPGDTSPPPSS